MTYTKEQIAQLRDLHANPMHAGMAWITVGGNPMALKAETSIPPKPDGPRWGLHIYYETLAWASKLDGGTFDIYNLCDCPDQSPDQVELILKAARLRKQAVEDMKARNWELIDDLARYWSSHEGMTVQVDGDGSFIVMTDDGDTVSSGHQSLNNAFFAAEPNAQKAARIMEVSPAAPTNPKETNSWPTPTTKSKPYAPYTLTRSSRTWLGL